MSAVPIEEFVHIEEALTERLVETWTEVAMSYLVEVRSLVAERKWHDAFKLANSVVLDLVYDDNKEFIRYSTYAAIFFGASRLTHELEAALLLNRTWDGLVDHVMELFREGIIYNATTQVRKALVTAIQAEEDRIKEAEQSVEKDDAKRILDPFVSFKEDGDKMLQLTAQLHTSRLSAFGFTAEAEMLGVTKYAISEQLDARICPVCLMMHGRVFEVVDARKALEMILRVGNPEDLKTIQEWPSQSKDALASMAKMTAAELVSKNWHIPPFHPGCRGLLVDVSKVPDLKAKPLDLKNPGVFHNEEPTADMSMFQEAGIPDQFIDEDMLKFWNDHLQIDPIALMSVLAGRTPMELLESVGDKAALTRQGFRSVLLDEQSGSLQFRYTGKMYGSEGDAEFSVGLQPEKKTMHVSFFEFAEEDQGKGYLKQWFQDQKLLLDALGYDKVDLLANIDIGGYAWAKYGFLPQDAKVWADLKDQIKAVIEEYDLMSRIKGVPKLVVERVLASDDPRALWSLADLKATVRVNGRDENLAKLLLRGSVWEGRLNLSDERSLTRFMTYLDTVK